MQRLPGCETPVEVILHRCVSLGIDPEKLTAEGRRVILSDPEAGTALGRLKWQFLANGELRRRMLDTGGIDAQGRPVLEPWITDEMSEAATEYRRDWARWCQMSGIPRRHPQAATMERSDRAHNHDALPVASTARRIAARVSEAYAALLACEERRLVVTMMDGVVIDNYAPMPLIAGERSKAFHALRRGLAALAEVRKRRR